MSSLIINVIKQAGVSSVAFGEPKDMSNIWAEITEGDITPVNSRLITREYLISLKAKKEKMVSHSEKTKNIIAVIEQTKKFVFISSEVETDESNIINNITVLKSERINKE
jgi:hypothetical protein